VTGPDWRETAEQAVSLPYGRARSTALEKALQQAVRDGAGEEDLFWLRMSLTQAYEYGGEPANAFATFTRCLSAFDADPARYGPVARSQLLWHFKWVVAALLDFPEIPLDRTRAVLDDMERRYREGGHSLHAVHGLRCRVARHLGDVETADAEFERWRTTARDETSDCEGCVPSALAAHLVWRGAHEEAVAVAEPVLSGQLTCTEQPQRILTTLMEPYLRTGRHDAAVDAHRRAYRVHRRQERHYLSNLGSHLFFCALTGNHARGLEILERHLGALDEPPSPMDALEFAASAALLLDRLAATGRGDLPVRRPAHGDRPAAELGAAELRDRLRDHAHAIAARFDARNGTTAQTDRVRDRLATEPVVDGLALSEYAPRPRGTAPAAPRPDVEPFAEDWADLLEQAEQWRRAGREELTRAAWRRFDELTADVDLPAWALGRRAEAEGWLRESAGDLAGAAEQYRAAAGHHAAAQRRADRHRALSRLGLVLVGRGAAEEGLALLEQAVVHLDEHGDPDTRVGARIRLASCLAERGDLPRARVLLEESDPDKASADTRAAALTLLAAVLAALGAPFAEQDALLGRAREAARESGVARLVVDAACRHARLLRAGGEETREAAWQALAEAEARLTADLPEELCALVALTRGHWLCEEQEYDRAASPLAEAVAQATAVGAVPMAAHARVLLARAYQGSGRHFEAAEVAEEALAEEERLGDVDRRMLREVLARSLTELGEFDGALARWDELLALEDVASSPVPAVFLHGEAAQLLSRMGRPAQAAERHAAAAALWEGLNEPYQAFEQHQRRAMALLAADEVDAAREAHHLAEQWLGRAEADPELRIPPEHVRFRRGTLHYDKARILWRDSSPEEAAAEAETALGLFAALGAEDAVGQVRALLDAIREDVG